MVRIRHGVDSATINLWDDVRKTKNIAIVSQLNCHIIYGLVSVCCLFSCSFGCVAWMN